MENVLHLYFCARNLVFKDNRDYSIRTLLTFFISMSLMLNVLDSGTDCIQLL